MKVKFSPLFPSHLPLSPIGRPLPHPLILIKRPPRKLAYPRDWFMVHVID